MSNGKIAINRGFVLGYAAIGILALLAGFVTNYSASVAIDASSAGQGSSCFANTSVQVVKPTAAEKEVFGDNAVAYTVTTVNNKRFKILTGAKEQSRIGSGGIVEFTAGIQNLNDGVYSDKKGRLWLKYLDGNTNKTLDFYYGETSIALGKYWYKTITTSMKDYQSALTIEMRTGSSHHLSLCIANIMNLRSALNTTTPTATVTSTATTTGTTTSTTTTTTTASVSTPSVTPTSTSSVVASYIMKNGYNAISVDDVYKITPFTGNGMVVFDYNRNGDKKWRSTARGDNISTIRPDLGYYVYNPGPEKTINIRDNRVVENPITYAFIKKGWNLLSTRTGGKLSDVNVQVLKTGQASACNKPECARATTLKTLFEGAASTRKAYAKIYRIVDGNSSDASTAFAVTEVTADNLDTVTIPAGSIYWVYLFDL